MFKHLNTRIPKRIEQEKDKVSAVMIPLIKKNDGYHILFEVRSNKLSQQPGEICFPGGRREADETSMEAAIRETCEELLVSKSDIELYGPLDYFLSPAGLRIDPYLGELVNYDGQYSNDEVSEIFTQHHLTPDVHFTTWDDYAIMSMVESGLGISVLPELILKRCSYDIEIKSLEEPFIREMGIIMKDRERLPIAVKRLLKYLV
nr:LysR substrate-binding domain-containing protein [uncultured Anaerostipes sp.]